jgi:DNA-binding Lrp family transcriptional regulator
MEISDIDAKILRALLEDGRKSYRDIARENNVSENIVYKHYKKMEKNGIIVGATTQENHPDVGYPIVAEIYTKASITDRVKANVEQYLKGKHGIRIFLFNPITRSFSIVVQMTSRTQFDAIKKEIEQLIFPETIYTDYWTGRTIERPENLSFGRYKDDILNKLPNFPYYRKPMIDLFDLKILEKLRENGRIPFSMIQREIGVSIDTISRKYQRMRKNGIIKVVVQVSAEKLGYSGTLFARIKLRSRRDTESALHSLLKIQDIFGIVELSGEYNLRIFALIRDIHHLMMMQQKISNIPSFKEAEIVLERELTDSFPSPRHWITNWR